MWAGRLSWVTRARRNPQRVDGAEHHFSSGAPEVPICVAMLPLAYAALPRLSAASPDRKYAQTCQVLQRRC